MDEKDEIIKLLEFDVSGMSCDRCAMWVTEAIKKNVENVVDVRVKSSNREDPATSAERSRM
jgi:copper chaperone CopZ